MAMRVREPCRRECVGFVRVNEVETRFLDQLPQPPRRADPPRAIANSMQSNTRSLRARRYRGIPHRHELCTMAAPL